MNDRIPGADEPKRVPWGLIGAAIVLVAVVYAGFVFFYRVM